MLKGRRAGLGILAFFVLAAAASTGMTASSVRRADASCNGAGAPALVSRYDGSGTLVAQEIAAYPGTTCNGDWYYVGAVLDPVTDGSCAYVYYLEPFAYYANQGASCTTGAWSVYSYADSIGTNSVFISPRPSYLSDSWVLSSGY
jgi:hypothetical protein